MAKLFFVSASAEQRPLSWASAVATICSMSVSLRSEKQVPV